MKKIFVLAIFFPSLSLAYFSSAELYPYEWVPDNFEAGVEESDFPDCKEALDNFHDAFEQFEDIFLEEQGSPINWPPVDQVVLWAEDAVDFNGIKITRGSDFIATAGEEIRLCLVNAVEWELEQEAIAEEQARKEAAEQYEQEQEDKLQKAIYECNLDYLESLSNSVKMATYDERMACKAKLAEEKSQSVGTVETYIAPVPTYVPPTPQPVIPIVSDIGLETETFNDLEEEVIINASTSDSEKIEPTKEELDRLVEEQVAKAMSETESEPEPEQVKPSIFKRVANFLFGWLW